MDNLDFYIKSSKKIVIDFHYGILDNFHVKSIKWKIVINVQYPVTDNFLDFYINRSILLSNFYINSSNEKL